MAAEFALSPLVVVTQTLVELVAMVVFVKLIPRLIRNTTESTSAGPIGEAAAMLHRALPLIAGEKEREKNERQSR